MKLAQNVLDSQQETYRLAKLRHKAGVISAIDLRGRRRRPQEPPSPPRRSNETVEPAPEPA